nr:tryptophan--tRNA ligase [Vallitalea okinawensis]
MSDKKILYSGMQPTGQLTLGNYLGALKNWLLLQEEYNCLFSVVDLHSLTVRQKPADLRKNARNLLMQYIAAGIDPEENIVYYQSHVSGHAELAWILNCYTHLGELNRMTQFKEKSAKHESNINAGLFTYPVLMAADILLFNTDLVPVGHDQKQHLELARDIASRFNNANGDVFTVPDPYIAKVAARVMSLQEPTKKMSKSDENPNAYILLLDEPNVIRNKIKRAVTDSDAEIRFDRGNKAGISNLIEIYSCFTGMTMDEVQSHFEGKGYGDFKKEVGDVVAEGLRPLQERYKELQKNKDYIDQIIKKNGETANYLAQKTLRKVKKKVGLPELVR